MDYILVCSAAVGVAALTLISGFGLGTLLMPVFALFFPLHIAIAATAAVHLLNNMFKLWLVGKNADAGVTLRFAVPAGFAAILGALALGGLSGMEPLMSYGLGGKTRDITPGKTVIAALLALAAYAELSPRFAGAAVGKKYIPLGGAVSGFFGGLSGLQGAMRAAFLIKAGLSKEGFIATSAACAVVVDTVRLSVYGFSFYAGDFSLLKESGIGGLVAAATLAAFIGSALGKRVMKRVTLRAVQVTVGVMLMAIAAALGTGLV